VIPSQGEVEFAPSVVLKGQVTVVNATGSKKTLAAGVYENTKVEL
jgi:hypothetical protein